jgi:hypothetical protein
VDSYLPLVREVLEQRPRLPARRLYHMIRDRGYAGSVEQLRRVVARSRPQPREAFTARTWQAMTLQVFPALTASRQPVPPRCYSNWTAFVSDLESEVRKPHSL